jgi:simple sugar transport system ATP-binding protein
VRQLTSRGKSIIFITHKLNEVLEIADRITVLRAGQVVGMTTPAEATEETLAAMMVGRHVSLVVDKDAAKPRDVVLEIDDLVVKDDRGHITVDGVDLQVRGGEIVAIAGVQGNGQTELVEAVTGLRKPLSGTIRISGEVVRLTPRSILEAGVAHVPEDRLEDGCVPAFSVAENLVLNTYYRPPFSRGLQLDREAIETAADQLVKDRRRTPSVLARSATCPATRR